MGVNLKTITEDRDDLYRVSLADAKVNIEERNRQKTIEKIQAVDDAIAMPPLPANASSLVGRVEDLPSPKEQLFAMDPENLRTIDKELGELQDHPPEPSYLILVQAAIGKCLAQAIRTSERDRIQKKEQEGKFTLSNKEWGTLQKEMGDRGLNFTWISLGLMLVPIALPHILPRIEGVSFNNADRDILMFLSDKGCTNISNMFNSETQSKQKQVDAISQLAMAEINAMMNKGSSDASKQELINLLDKIYESLKRAAQAGG